MKRIILISLITVVGAGLLFAQGVDRLSGESSESEGFAGFEKTRISGNLGISQGFISVESDGVVYYVIGLDRFTGFIDGLKAGAAVTLEGYVLPRQNAAPARRSRDTQEFMRQNQNPRFFRVTKLSLDGKDYDLSPPPGAERFRQREFTAPCFTDEPRDRAGHFPRRRDLPQWDKIPHERDWRR